MDFNTNNASNAPIEGNELFDAQIHLYKHISSYLSSVALKIAVELGIADAIHNYGKPMTLSELATSLKLHNPFKINVLYRFLQLLTHDGFFAKTTVKGKEGDQEEIAYALTPSSKLLISGKSVSLAPLVKLTYQVSGMHIWYSSKKWFTEENELSLFESAKGETFWDLVNKDSQIETLNMFQEAMAADSYVFKVALKDCKHVFEGLESLVDVAGGTGGMTKLIHEAFPHIKCTVFDQPEVVGSLIGDENLNFVGGDMFKSIPPADAVLLKWVLHNWSDELSLKILKNSKEAISGKGKNGKVIIIDISIDETNEDKGLTKLQLNFDMLMLTLYNGKEREKKEWEKLIYEAGFSSYKITPICGYKSLIEIFP